MRIKPLIIIFIIAFSLNGCSWWGDDDKPRAVGERVAILQLSGQLQAETEQDITLSVPWQNDLWTQPGGFANRLAGHIALSGQLQQTQSVSFGTAEFDNVTIVNPPVIADQTVYTVDLRGVAQATDINSGRIIWQTDLLKNLDASRVFGAGIAYSDKTLYAINGYSQIFALDSVNGNILWQRDLQAPLRAAPLVVDTKVFVLSADNKLFVLDTKTGETIWLHSDVTRETRLLSSVSPSVINNTVLVPYSTGNIYGLRLENGQEIWADNISSTSGLTTVFSLTDIGSYPVLTPDRAIVSSVTGQIITYDLVLGRRLWQRPITTYRMPWLSGEVVFVTTDQGEAVALNANTGKVIWVKQLPETDMDLPLWHGPILAGGRLLIIGFDGTILELGPQTGDIQKQWAAGDDIPTPPVVVSQKLILLTRGGEIQIYK